MTIDSGQYPLMISKTQRKDVSKVKLKPENL